MYRNPFEVAYELICNVVARPKDVFYEFIFSIPYVTAIFAVLAVIIFIWKRMDETKDDKDITSYRAYMDDVHEACLVCQDKETGAVQKVTGSIARFIKDFVHDEEHSDDELSNMIRRYCSYVDKEYGPDVSNVEENIGTDYVRLLMNEI